MNLLILRSEGYVSRRVCKKCALVSVACLGSLAPNCLDCWLYGTLDCRCIGLCVDCSWNSCKCDGCGYDHRYSNDPYWRAAGHSRPVLNNKKAGVSCPLFCYSELKTCWISSILDSETGLVFAVLRMNSFSLLI